MPAVNFFYEDIEFKVPQPLKAKNWIKEAIKAEGFSLIHLNYIFCSDDYLLQINQEYLNHNTLTDIITFDNSDKSGVIEGDVFISVERVKENAMKFSKEETNELLRVLIHGALHLMGYKDKTSQAKAEMRKKEDAYLSLF